jgi:hypothetical protein
MKYNGASDSRIKLYSRLADTNFSSVELNIMFHKILSLHENLCDLLLNHMKPGRRS